MKKRITEKKIGRRKNQFCSICGIRVSNYQAHCNSDLHQFRLAEVKKRRGGPKSYRREQRHHRLKHIDKHNTHQVAPITKLPQYGLEFDKVTFNFGHQERGYLTPEIIDEVMGELKPLEKLLGRIITEGTGFFDLITQDRRVWKKGILELDHPKHGMVLFQCECRLAPEQHNFCTLCLKQYKEVSHFESEEHMLRLHEKLDALVKFDMVSNIFMSAREEFQTHTEDLTNELTEYFGGVMQLIRLVVEKGTGFSDSDKDVSVMCSNPRVVQEGSVALLHPEYGPLMCIVVGIQQYMVQV